MVEYWPILVYQYLGLEVCFFQKYTVESSPNAKKRRVGHAGREVEFRFRLCVTAKGVIIDTNELLQLNARFV